MPSSDGSKEPTIQIPQNLPLQASSSNSIADPAHDGSDQWVTTELQHLELGERATGMELRNGASDGEDGVREANGKSEVESHGDDQIESEKLVVDDDDGDGEIDGKNAESSCAFPVRPEALDCAFYMKTGNCRYGANCKFNHPVGTQIQVTKEKTSEDNGQKSRKMECKFYLRTGGCKYGKDCRYFHKKEKPHVVAPVSDLNFLGLPIRPGEKECIFYMRNGSCKFGTSCKFNHPDPEAVGGADPAPVYVDGVPGGPTLSSEANVAPWSVPRPLNETAPYVPVMPSSQGVASQSLEWNGYHQTPAFPQPQERNMRPSAAFLTNNITTGTGIYVKNQVLPSEDEFPERPGEPVCGFFLKTGVCKFKSNCRYHHPNNRAPKPPPCALSDKGLPLRPDQNICSHYSRYGICKFGPACKFDHRINLPAPSLPDVDKPVASTN